MIKKPTYKFHLHSYKFHYPAYISKSYKFHIINCRLQSPWPCWITTVLVCMSRVGWNPSWFPDYRDYGSLSTGIWSLRWLFLYLRSYDLVGSVTFSVCMCARFQASPRESHLNATKKILRYLKHTQNVGLWYPKGAKFELVGYSNSDYAWCKVERKSTSGTCQLLERSLVSWSSKK